MAVPYSVKYTNIEATDAIEKYLEEHLAKLDLVVDDNDESADAQIELSKALVGQQTGDVYQAEINLHIAGQGFYVTENASDIYAAIDLMRDVIVRDVKRHYEKNRDQVRSGARQFKEMLHKE